MTGTSGALLGDRVAYWIDPLGAMLLATYITWNWGNTAIENIKALVGLSATPEFLQKLTFLCFNHHSEVMKIDTVRVIRVTCTPLTARRVSRALYRRV